MQDKLRLASVLFANTQIQIELIDNLKGTALYRQSFKNLYNRTQKENIKLIDNFYKNMNEDSEQILFDLQNIVENFVKVVAEKDINVLKIFLEDYLNDNLKIEEE